MLFSRFAAPGHVEHENRGVAIRGQKRSGTHPVIGEEALRLHDRRRQRLDGRAQGVHKSPKDRIRDRHLVRADNDHFGGVMHIAPELRDQLRGNLGLRNSGEFFLRANGGVEQGGDEEHRDHHGHEPPPDGFPGVCHTEAQEPCHRHMRKHRYQSGPPSAQPLHLSGPVCSCLPPWHDLGVQGEGPSMVFNVEANPREEHNPASQYAWGIGPLLKAVEANKACLPQHPNPTAAPSTRFVQPYRMELGQDMHPRRHVDPTDGGVVFPV